MVPYEFIVEHSAYPVFAICLVMTRSVRRAFSTSDYGQSHYDDRGRDDDYNDRRRDGYDDRRRDDDGER